MRLEEIIAQEVRGLSADAPLYALVRAQVDHKLGLARVIMPLRTRAALPAFNLRETDIDLHGKEEGSVRKLVREIIRKLQAVE